MKKLTTEEFIEKAKKIHKGKYDYSKVVYKNSIEKVCIICPIHGEFWTKPNTHLNGKSCPKCSHRSFSYTLEEFIEKAKKVHGNKYNYSKVEYINSKTKVCIICPKHGEFWQTPYCHLNGQGCSRCGHDKVNGLKKLSNEDYKKRAIKIHGDFYDYSNVEYIDAHSKIKIVCPIHGMFLQTASDHLQGRGCPKCSNSKLENQLVLLFDENEIKYIHHCNSSVFKWLNKQHLDFYLPKYNIAIECQGEQHYRPANFGSSIKTKEECFKIVKDRDVRKLELCEQNGVKLLYFSNKRYEDNVIIDEKALLETIKSSIFLNY